MPSAAPSPPQPLALPDPTTPARLRALAERWSGARAAERANAQSYLIELCEALGVERPRPAGSGYEFEYPVWFERGIIRERTKAGLAAAKARGRVGGRRRQVIEAQAAEVRALLAPPNASVRAVCERFGRSRFTVYRYAPAPTPAIHGPGA